MKLCFDQAIEVYCFLGAEEACKLSSTCKVLREVFLILGDRYWELLCKKKYSLSSLLQLGQHHHLTYLDIHERLLSSEIKHVTTMRNNYEGMILFLQSSKASTLSSIYNKLQSTFSADESREKNRVHGIVSDIFWTDDEKLSLVLSKFRFQALPTILVDDQSDVFAMKKITSSSQRGPASHLPLSDTLQNLDEARAALNALPLSDSSAPFPGLVGYAVNLFRMRPEHESFRLTVLYTLFKDLLIFTTGLDKIAYEATLQPAARSAFRGIALDDYPAAVLADTFPRFRWGAPRPDYARQLASAAGGGGGSSGGVRAGTVDDLLLSLGAAVDQARSSAAAVRLRGAP